jgi:outer membrane lipoprotein-sorting protein
MRPTEKKIHNLIQNLNDKTRPELDQKILDDCFIELENQVSSTPPAGPTIWRIIMNSKFTKPIAAAIIIIAAILSLTFFDKVVAPAYAVEKTVEALRGVQNLRIKMTMNEKTVELLMLINQQTGLADRIRMDDRDTGNVTITIPDQTYMYSKQKNEVTLIAQKILVNDLNFKDVINSLIEQTHAADGQLKITKRLDSLAGQDVIAVTIIRKDNSVAGEFLIEPKSNLPIYIGTEASKGQLNYMGPIEYNVQIAKDAFEFNIPKGAKVTDNRPEELKQKQPKTAEPFSYDLSETAAAMKKAYNGYAEWIDRKGRRVKTWAVIDPNTGRIGKMRMEYEDGGLYIMANGKTYFEDDGMKGIQEGLYINPYLLFNDFITAAAQKVNDQDVMTIEKQFNEEFQREVFHVLIKRFNVHLDVIVDMDTKLPLKFSIPWVDYPAEPLDHTERIEYNVDFPEGIFDYETGPDTMVLGTQLDTKMTNDPNYGIPYGEDEDVQVVCQILAAQYLQAKIDGDFDTIKSLHPIYINRFGSNKMIEKNAELEAYQNGRIVKVLEYGEAYEYESPKSLMVPCKLIKDYRGKQKEMVSGVLVYLRRQNEQKSAVIIGYFPYLRDK